METAADADNFYLLVVQTGSADFNTRQAAFAALCGWGEPTRRALLGGMLHESGSVRAHCTALLGEISDSDTHVAPLCQMLYDKRVPVRRAAVHALFTRFSPARESGGTSDARTQAANAIAHCAENDTSPVVRKAARHAHEHLTRRAKVAPTVDPPLPDVWTVLRLEPTDDASLPPLRTIDTAPLVELLGVRQAHVRREAAGVLFARGASVLDAVTTGFSHPCHLVRRACADLMDHLADETCLTPLTRVLGDKDAGVRRAALHSLTCQVCKPSPLQGDRVEALIKRALHDSDVRIRRVATGALIDLVQDERANTALRFVAENSQDAICATRARNGLKHSA